jgi:hypothetical protein
MREASWEFCRAYGLGYVIWEFGLSGIYEQKRSLTSFNCRTFPIIPSTCPSFWLSNSFRTASLYWPLYHRKKPHQPDILISRSLLLPLHITHTSNSASPFYNPAYPVLLLPLPLNTHIRRRGSGSRWLFASGLRRRGCSSRRARCAGRAGAARSCRICAMGGGVRFWL